MLNDDNVVAEWNWSMCPTRFDSKIHVFANKVRGLPRIAWRSDILNQTSKKRDRIVNTWRDWISTGMSHGFLLAIYAPGGVMVLID